MGTHVIVIEPEPFGFGVDVLVRPVPDGIGHDREFSSVAAARDYAGRLSQAMGWEVRDLCSEGAS